MITDLTRRKLAELADYVEKGTSTGRWLVLMHDNPDPDSIAAATWKRNRDAAEAELFEWVTSVGGSVTGEHGIGWSQRRYLPLTAPPGSIEVMRALKSAFDPAGILNPGKIFADE